MPLQDTEERKRLKKNPAAHGILPVIIYSAIMYLISYCIYKFISSHDYYYFIDFFGNRDVLNQFLYLQIQIITQLLLVY